MNATYKATNDGPANRPLTEGKIYEPTSDINGSILILCDSGRDVWFFREEVKKYFEKSVSMVALEDDFWLGACMQSRTKGKVYNTFKVPEGIEFVNDRGSVTKLYENFIYKYFKKL